MMIKYAKAKVSSKNRVPEIVKLSDYGLEAEPGFFYFSSRAVDEGVNENYDAFPAEELRQNYKTFEGDPLFLNHESESVEKSVGKIPKAILIEEIPVWVKTINALDEKNHPDLADKVRRGIITDVSMGCYVNYSVCSICGHQSRTEFDYCDHIKYHKGTIDPETGKLVFEICKGVSFFELSLVTAGADLDAQVWEILSSVNALDETYKLPKYSDNADDGLYIFEEFKDKNFPAFILAKKENGVVTYIPITYFQNFRMPGRWTKDINEAVKQLESRGISPETQFKMALDGFASNPKFAKIIEPVYDTIAEKEEPSLETKKIWAKIMSNNFMPKDLSPREALFYWNKLKGDQEVFKRGDPVRWNGRVAVVRNTKNGIAELELNNGETRKVVEYMLSKTFPPSKKAVFETYLKLTNKKEDECSDVFIEGKELEYDKDNVLKAYRNVIGDEDFPEEHIKGLAVFLSRKPWLDLDKIAEHTKNAYEYTVDNAALFIVSFPKVPKNYFPWDLGKALYEANLGMAKLFPTDEDQRKYYLLVPKDKREEAKTVLDTYAPRLNFDWVEYEEEENNGTI